MFGQVSKKSQHAFTLIELLVVIAIISLLVSVLLPSLGKAKDLAKEVMCSSSLRNVGMAVLMYSTDNDGFVPPVNWQDPDWEVKGFWDWSYPNRNQTMVVPRYEVYTWDSRLVNEGYMDRLLQIGCPVTEEEYRSPCSKDLDGTSLPGEESCSTRSYALNGNLNWFDPGNIAEAQGDSSLAMGLYNCVPLESVATPDSSIMSHAADSLWHEPPLIWWDQGCYIVGEDVGWRAPPGHGSLSRLPVLWVDGHVTAEEQEYLWLEGGDLYRNNIYRYKYSQTR
jgi:prepilin-type N-terminal cleavage/methylation domain-containing protein/prepilin-type processing-associated H-X9-DG protein